MSKFIITWETGSERKEAVTPVGAIEIQGKELRIASLGITNAMLAGSISDDKLVESYIKQGDINSDMFTYDGTSGLMLDYDLSEFQFIPGTGLSLNVVPTSKLESDVVLTGGTRAFTQPQGGVDAVADTDLTTLGQVNTLISAAIAGDFTETIINLSGQSVVKGHVGYVESTSGAFRLAKADSPTTAKVQYACVNSSPIADGASGSFQNPSVEVNNVAGFVSGIGKGGTLWLSTSEWGMFQSAAPSVSGLSIVDCGWVKPDGTGYVLFPQEAIDL